MTSDIAAEAAVTEVAGTTEESLGPPLKLPEFSGPLDLLLHLIRKNKVSIYDIPIASICDQYHLYLKTMQELDLAVAGEFLWMASWLLQLKSRLLLPKSKKDAEDDPRIELVERLVEYRRVKELAAMLHDQDVVRRCLWQPEVETRLQIDEQEIDWEDVDLRLLASLYLDAMQRFQAAHPPPLPVLPLRFRVEDKMRELYEKVRQDGLLALLRHLHSRADNEEVVTMVVATLELVRLGGVLAEQRLPFAEIYLRPGQRLLESEALLSRIDGSEEPVSGS
jgi:segregation and condensation protein A